MEILTKAGWAALALIHLAPIAPLFAPAATRQLYGVEGGGSLGVLLEHRGALFLAALAACLIGMFDPASRRAVGVVVAISVVGFLFVYLRAGAPSGALRTVALVDLIGLAPLAWVLFSAWRAHAA